MDRLYNLMILIARFIFKMVALSVYFAFLAALYFILLLFTGSMEVNGFLLYALPILGALIYFKINYPYQDNQCTIIAMVIWPMIIPMWINEMDIIWLEYKRV